MEVPHPESYVAYAFTRKNGPLEKFTMPWKDPGPHQIIVKVLACGICGSDDLVETQRFNTGLPRVPGHEIVGDIVAVHQSERQFKVGDRIGCGWHGSHCGMCTWCRAGDFVECENEEIVGVTFDGGVAEYVTLRSEAVSWIPEDMDPAEAAPMLCAGLTAFNALRHMDVSPGERVAIQGIGGLGHLALQFSRAMGFRTIALSHSDSKRECAHDLGVVAYIDSSKQDVAAELQKMGGVKAVVCTAPHPEIMEGLIPALVIGGQLLLVAFPIPKITFNLSALVTKRLSIRGWPCGNAKEGEECIAFAKQMGVKCMVEKFPLVRAQEAYDHRNRARFRAVIVP